jgi:hypothetical protein
MDNRRDEETPREDVLTDQIIGSVIEVRTALGPGLLESAYEECLCHDQFQRTRFEGWLKTPRESF